MLQCGFVIPGAMGVKKAELKGCGKLVGRKFIEDKCDH